MPLRSLPPGPSPGTPPKQSAASDVTHNRTPSVRRGASTSIVDGATASSLPPTLAKSASSPASLVAPRAASPSSVPIDLAHPPNLEDDLRELLGTGEKEAIPIEDLKALGFDPGPHRYSFLTSPNGNQYIISESQPHPSQSSKQRWAIDVDGRMLFDKELRTRAAPDGPQRTVVTSLLNVQQELELLTIVNPRLRIHDVVSVANKAKTYDGKVHVLMDRMGGDVWTLADRLHGRHPSSLPTTNEVAACVAARLCEDLFASLARCHEEGVVHRDVKLENILFNDNNQFFLSDMGSASYIDEHGVCPAATGTWFAPELLANEPNADGRILSQQGATASLDMWQAGLALAMFHGGVRENPLAEATTHYRDHSLQPHERLKNMREVFDAFSSWRASLFDEAGELHLDRITSTAAAEPDTKRLNAYFAPIARTNPALLSMILRTLLVPDPTARLQHAQVKGELRTLYRAAMRDPEASRLAYTRVAQCAQPADAELAVKRDLNFLLDTYLAE